jgi:hypothetical protein
MVEVERLPEATRAERDALPLITLDFDGVLCTPPFGNLGIQRTFLDPAAEPRPASVPPRWLSVPWDHLRFDFRRPMPDARAGLEALHALRRVAVLTGRRTSPREWLRRYGLEGFVDEIVINGGALKSPHFKLEALGRLQPLEHVEDDPRTAELLARRSQVRIYLRDWARNRGLAFAPSVTRISDLRALVAILQIPGSRE